MKITAIKTQVKNPDRVSIFLDGKYSFSLTLDQLLHEKIKKGVEVDEHEIERLQKLSADGKARARALEWVLMRPHSVQEFRMYGFRKKIEKDLLQAWADEFLQRKYLDDKAFAVWFAENRSRKNKSTRAILSELATKGVARDIAGEVVSDLGQEDASALDVLVAKLRKRTRYKDDQKLMQYLAGKGFRYDDIRKAIEGSNSN